MPKADDPYYNRKPVPKEFIEDVGITGLTPQEEFAVRERKYSLPDGSDVRKFSNVIKPQHDPYYGRKPVAKPQIAGVGETGLTPQEEFENRERKYSLADGSDARRFSNVLTPQTDPYYARKSVSKKGIVGVGETGATKAEEYEVRERKQSLFQLSSDPFQLLSGSGHRQSVSAVGGEAAIAASRRRSSAVAPNAAQAAANTHHHSGYDGDRLEPIESKRELPATNSSMGASDSTAAESHTNGQASHAAQHPGHEPTYYDAATADPDSVAPDERR